MKAKEVEAAAEVVAREAGVGVEEGT